MNDTQKGKLALLIGTTNKACDLYAAIVDLIENDIEANIEQWYSTEFCMPNEGQIVKYTLGDGTEYQGAITDSTHAIHWCAITE